MKPHWREQDFTRWMFGVQDEDEHVRGCIECQAELSRLQAVRKSVTAEPEVSSEFLAAQRRSILNRLDEGSSQTLSAHRWSRTRVWAPLSAGVVLAALGVALWLPPKAAQQPLFTESDRKFFTEISSMEQSSEPRAIEPIHNMFEE